VANILTNVGEDWVAQRLVGAGALSGFDMHFLGWGTGAGTAAKGDTTLFTEAAEARATAVISATGSGATAKYQAVGTLTSASAQTITNAGLFSASAAGSMAVKWDHTGVALAIGEGIQYTVTLDPA
jgi:hypothetical protein